jgi:dipeptidyl aminopeptidase/acylaminoacyl peptidase
MPMTSPQRARCLAIGACIFLLVALPSEAGDARHPVTLADLESLSFPDVTLELSPDGRWLAYALASDSVWMVRTRAGAVPKQIGRGFLPSWSPASDKIAFYSLASGDIQLGVYDLKTETSDQLTKVAGGIDPDPATRIVGYVHDAFRYGWSPDGARLVFPSRVPVATQPEPGAEPAGPVPASSAAPLILTNTTPPEWTLSGVFVRPRLSAGTLESKDGHTISAKRNDSPGAVLTNQLFIVELRNHELRKVTLDERNYFNPQFSADGKEVLTAVSSAPGPLFGTNDIDVVAFDFGSGRSRNLAHGEGVRSRPSLRKDGRMVAFFESNMFVGRPAVRVAEADGSKPRDVAAALDREIEDFGWSADGRSILAVYQDGLSQALGRIDLSSGRAEPIAPGASALLPVIIRGFSVSKAGSLAWTQQDPAHPSSIQFLAPRATHPITLVDLQPQVQHWRLGSVEIIRWRNAHGDAMEGTLLKPPDYVAGRRYPLIVDAYPLVGGADWTSPMLGNQAWASSGYMVFRPSARAPHVWMNSWKSEASSSVAKGPRGWNLMKDDVMSGVDAVLRRGDVEAQRMCLYGFSNGGGVVNYLVTETERFKCAVSVAGALSDWVRPALLNTGQDQMMAQFAGVALRDDPDAYIKLSAVFRLNRVKTPMLLADGDNDGEFLLDTIEMYNGLRSAGVDVTLLRYPEQGHGFTGAALADFWQREMEFFKHYLEP